jgi:hypothetical protein
MKKNLGNISPYIVSYLYVRVNEKTKSEQVWIFAFQGGFPFAMVLAGYIEKRYGPRVSGLIGSVILT